MMSLIGPPIPSDQTMTSCKSSVYGNGVRRAWAFEITPSSLGLCFGQSPKTNLQVFLSSGTCLNALNSALTKPQIPGLVQLLPTSCISFTLSFVLFRFLPPKVKSRPCTIRQVFRIGAATTNRPNLEVRHCSFPNSHFFPP